jgi:hypothetical protein
MRVRFYSVVGSAAWAPSATDWLHSSTVGAIVKPSDDPAMIVKLPDELIVKSFDDRIEFVLGLYDRRETMRRVSPRERPWAARAS